jgi:hypothetical protein
VSTSDEREYFGGVGLAIIVAVAIVSGCSEPDPNISFGDPLQRDQFEKNLRREGINYRVEEYPGSGEHIVWSEKDDAAVQQLIENLIASPPQRNSACLTPDRFREEFKASLSDAGIPFDERYQNGMYCVIWEERFSGAVRSLEGGRYKFIFLDEQQKLRDGQR